MDDSKSLPNSRPEDPLSSDHGKSIKNITAIHTLQSMVLPDAGLGSESELYIRPHGSIRLSDDSSIYLRTGAEVHFNTWFNLFNIGKWVRFCDLQDLHLSVRGAGHVELTIYMTDPHNGRSEIGSQVLSLNGECKTAIDIPDLSATDTQGVLYFRLRALDDTTLNGACWQTRQTPRRVPELMLVITTYQREQTVAVSMKRFEDFVATSVLAPHLHLTVIDNGNSIEPASTGKITIVANRNFGGAGGFARGLIEAGEQGSTHCLFMDDDAAVHMDAVARAWAFLAFAHDPDTAVAGAMISNTCKWQLWENGAIFNNLCVPQFTGTDLREQDQIISMEYETNQPAPRLMYGGWWFFAFPIASVRHMPFPFFVRGDDISFGLANDFKIVRLNGVVSFQDGFAGKESPLVMYLDLRNHLVHHLVFPELEVGWHGLTRIALWFFLKSLIRLHYETMTALNMAVEDVLQGPDFFGQNPDFTERRKQLAALRKNEAWSDRELPVELSERRNISFENPITRGLMKLTANGHLLPFFRLYGNHLIMSPETRTYVRPAWGAAKITVINPETGQNYTVTHSKSAVFREGFRMIRNIWRLYRAYPKLVTDWRTGYDKLTTTDYWKSVLRPTK
ncbi:hypothetical protein [Pseudaestuariivita rosea]|uniref:hypothetical protein n=1 Tax=Pseudaestuariivita rosea TaxID=2763263 RepID=UPI001ABB7FE6|nr:hypothetical protein [Pseudaestuariivita rosea]